MKELHVANCIIFLFKISFVKNHIDLHVSCTKNAILKSKLYHWRVFKEMWNRKSFFVKLIWMRLHYSAHSTHLYYNLLVYSVANFFGNFKNFANFFHKLALSKLKIDLHLMLSSLSSLSWQHCSVRALIWHMSMNLDKSLLSLAHSPHIFLHVLSPSKAYF